MTEETTIPTDPRDALKLKLLEPDVSTEKPWQDDALDRAKIAERLTNLIRDQRDPFVVSIDGQWGTGKTFLLKRWQQELENNEFKVIYFNAWEDDFCDDPLLSIIGQLSEYFKKGKLKAIAEELSKIAIPLLKKNALSVFNKATGLTLEVDLNERDLLKEYRDQRQTKTELKDHLKRISAAVVEETGHPLVFIIDELDRCRPTFAIELLERVKHIFDIPNMVFVFGVNRNELCNSLKSVYGEIDATVYLRRFFDMEFTLPEVNSETFCTFMMTQFKLHEFFHSLGRNANLRTNSTDFDNLSQAFPKLCLHLGLSLRDIVYCVLFVSLIALAVRNLPESLHMNPWLLSLLVTLKLKKLKLYRQLIQGECYASDVMNYIYDVVSLPIVDSQLDFELNAIEADLYLADDKRRRASGEQTVWHQLNLLNVSSDLTHGYLLSQRTKASDSARIAELIRRTGPELSARTPSNVLDYLAELIDLHNFVRR